MRSSNQREKLIEAFQALDIQPTISWKRIRSAYRKQISIWHPDRNNDSKASEKTILINEAYSLLQPFFSEKGKLMDTSGLLSSLCSKTDHSIKTNHRGKVKERLIRYYDGGLAQGDGSTGNKLEIILIHLNFWFCVINIVLLPPVLIGMMGWNGLLLALTSNVIFLLFTMSAARNLHRIGWISPYLKR